MSNNLLIIHYPDLYLSCIDKHTHSSNIIPNDKHNLMVIASKLLNLDQALITKDSILTLRSILMLRSHIVDHTDSMLRTGQTQRVHVAL